MKRYDCLKALAQRLPEDTIVVANQGNTARMFYELRPAEAGLYAINMGSCAAIALGLALALPHRKVVTLDGDGNLLLNLAVLCDIANQNPTNLSLIVFDNASYEAAGGLPSATQGLADLAAIARASGIAKAKQVQDLEEFAQSLEELLAAQELSFLNARVEMDGESYAPPQLLPSDRRENKYQFVRYIERSEGIPILRGQRGSHLVL